MSREKYSKHSRTGALNEFVCEGRVIGAVDTPRLYIYIFLFFLSRKTTRIDRAFSETAARCAAAVITRTTIVVKNQLFVRVGDKTAIRSTFLFSSFFLFLFLSFSKRRATLREKPDRPSSSESVDRIDTCDD